MRDHKMSPKTLPKATELDPQRAPVALYMYVATGSIIYGQQTMEKAMAREDEGLLRAFRFLSKLNNYIL